MTARLAKILFIVWLISAFDAGANGAEKINFRGAEIIGYGVFKIKRTRALYASHTASRRLWQTVPTKLVATTTNVDARLRTTFGVVYRIKGMPQNAQTEVLVRLTRPRVRKLNSMETSSVETWTAPVFIGVPAFSCFTFDHPGELVPGRWTFRVSYGSKVLIEKGFNVRLRQ